jgi:hypothetical protein
MQQQRTIPSVLAATAAGAVRRLRDQLQGFWAPTHVKLFCVGTTFLPDLPTLLARPEIAWHRFLRRSSEIDLLATEGPPVLMVRLPSIAFFAELEDSRGDSSLDEFAVRPEGGVLDLAAARRRTPVWALELAARASRADAAWNMLSATQQVKIDARRRVEFDDLLATPAGAAALLDVFQEEGIDFRVALAGPCSCGSTTPFGECHGVALRRALAL